MRSFAYMAAGAALVFVSVSGSTITSCAPGFPCSCNDGSDCDFTCSGGCSDSSLVCSANSSSCAYNCTAGSCMNAHLVCLSEACTLNCVGTEACAGAAPLQDTLSATDEGQGYGLYCSDEAETCDVTCSGDSACTNATSYCGGTSCSLTCSTAGSCESMASTIAVSSDYVLTCARDSSCRYATINAMEAGNVIVNCADNASCAGLQLECPSAGNCTINCESSGACKNTTIVCPDDVDDATCQLNCSASGACTEITMGNIAGSLTAICAFSDACSESVLKYIDAEQTDRDLGACTSWGRSATAPEYVTPLWCSTVCSVLPDEEGCAAYCACHDEAGSGAAACTWETNVDGLSNGYTNAMCDMFCTEYPDSSICWGKNQSEPKSILTLCECVAANSTSNFVELTCKKDENTVDTCTCPANATCGFLCDEEEICKESAMTCSGTGCTFSCSAEESCAQSTMSCADATGDCFFECSGYESCKEVKGLSVFANKKQATALAKKDDDDADTSSGCVSKASAVMSPGIVCGADVGTCGVTCSSDSSCQDTKIECSAANCSLACSDYGACSGLEHKCDGENCTAECSSDSSCAEAIFDWKASPKNATLICSDYESCKEASIECPEDASCTVKCTGAYSCKGLQLICPTTLAAGQECLIECLGSNSCEDIDNDKLCGEVTAVCDGSDACGDDLEEKVSTVSSDTKCTWQPNGWGSWKGYSTSSCTKACAKNVRSGKCKNFCTCVPANTPAPSSTQCNAWKPLAFSFADAAICNLWCPFQANDAWCSSHCECDESAVACSQSSTCSCPAGDDACSFACDSWGECADSTLTCGSGACAAVCSKKQACYDSTITCANDSPTCDITCSGYLSCTASASSNSKKSARLSSSLADDDNDASDNDDQSGCGVNPNTNKFSASLQCSGSSTACDVDCSGTQACEGIDMECSSASCELSCGGSSSCASSRHKCTGGACEADCGSYMSCAKTTFLWSEANSSVSLSCTDTKSCWNAVVMCPKAGCTVTCTGYKSCEGMALVCPDDLDANATCSMECSGSNSCTSIGNGQVCGDVSLVCSGTDACSPALTSKATSTDSAVCVSWEPVTWSKKYGWVQVSADYCDALCGGYSAVLNGFGNYDNYGFYHSQASKKYCKTGHPHQLCECSAWSVPSTPVPTIAPSNYSQCEVVNTTYGLDCPALCEDPLTDIVCTGEQQIPQLCSCNDNTACSNWVVRNDSLVSLFTYDCPSLCLSLKAADIDICDSFCVCGDEPTPAPATSPVDLPCEWTTIDSANDGLVLCSALCSSSFTSAFCDGTSGVEQLCTCETCSAFTLTSAASILNSTVDCTEVCTSGSVADSLICSQVCECAGSSSATLAPVTVDVTRVQLFRIRLDIGFLMFFSGGRRSRFRSVMQSVLRVHGIAVVATTIHWTCPATACPNGECPDTRAEKIAAGCTAAGDSSSSADRWADVLAASGDATYVEMDFATEDGASTNTSAISAAIQDEIQAGSSSDLSEFEVASVTTVEAEVVVSATPSPGGSSGSDGLEAWAIGVIVTCVCLCVLLVAIGVFCCVKNRGKKSSPACPDDCDDFTACKVTDARV